MDRIAEHKLMDRIPIHEPDYDRLDTNPVASPDDDEESEDGYTCPWCTKEHQTTEHIRICSGWKPSGMPPNETGHEYGCGCQDCMEEYRGLK